MPDNFEVELKYATDTISKIQSKGSDGVSGLNKVVYEGRVEGTEQNLESPVSA